MGFQAVVAVPQAVAAASSVALCMKSFLKQILGKVESLGYYALENMSAN